MTSTLHGRRTTLAAVGILLSAVAAPALPAHGATLGYWRFEGEGSNVPTAGSTQVEDTNGRAVTNTGVGVRVPDASGNGNTLWAWDHAFAGYTYQSAVPAPVVPQTGAANTLSVQNAGSFPALMTWSRESAPGAGDIETIKPLAWTIEASIFATANSGFRTLVGRDGNGVDTTGGPAGWAPLYFQSRNGNLAIQFTDEAGTTYQLADTTGNMALNSWYNVAAVSDGSLLSLYRDSGTGYQLVGTTPLTSSDTRLAYDDNGSSSAGDAQWGWTFGRGRFGTADGQGDGHVDRWFGNLDEIRISDVALTPNQFLFSEVPEPSGAMALGIVGAAALRRRRKA